MVELPRAVLRALGGAGTRELAAFLESEGFTMSTTTKSVTIANGASLSSVADMENYRLSAIIMPAAWTQTTDIDFVTFQASVDGVNFGDFFSAYHTSDPTDSEISVVVAAGRTVSIDRLFSLDFLGLRYWKIRSGSSGSPLNQAAAREIILVGQL